MTTEAAGGGRVNEGGRVNSHVTGPSCSVDGKREIQQPQKKGMMDVVFIKTPEGHFQPAGQIRLT